MRTRRPLAVVAAAIAALTLALTAPAGAQTPYEATVDTVCDTTTGDYVTTLTLTNNVNEDAELSGSFAFETANEDTGGGPITFVPATLPAEGLSVATITTPGDTIVIDIEYLIEYSNFEEPGEATIELDEECEPEVTTTTTSTSTTTPPPPERVRPTFTG